MSDIMFCWAERNQRNEIETTYNKHNLLHGIDHYCF